LFDKARGSRGGDDLDVSEIILKQNAADGGGAGAGMDAGAEDSNDDGGGLDAGPGDGGGTDLEKGVIVSTDEILELNVFESHKSAEEKERELKLEYR